MPLQCDVVCKGRFTAATTACPADISLRCSFISSRTTLGHPKASASVCGTAASAVTGHFLHLGQPTANGWPESVKPRPVAFFVAFASATLFDGELKGILVCMQLFSSTIFYPSIQCAQTCMSVVFRPPLTKKSKFHGRPAHTPVLLIHLQDLKITAHLRAMSCGG